MEHKQTFDRKVKLNIMKQKNQKISVFDQNWKLSTIFLKFQQIHQNFSKFTKISANSSKFQQIHQKFRKFNTFSANLTYFGKFTKTSIIHQNYIKSSKISNNSHKIQLVSKNRHKIFKFDLSSLSPDPSHPQITLDWTFLLNLPQCCMISWWRTFRDFLELSVKQ